VPKSRRDVLAAVIALSGCAYAGVAPQRPELALLNRAIAAAGGERALARARVLAWTGEASVFAGGQRLDLGVETVVEPFVYARSDTWLRDKGRATLRSLEIIGDEGWLTRGGARSPLPAAMLRHERQQFAIYGLMRLVALREPGTVLNRLADTPDGLQRLRAIHPKAPEADLLFAPDGKLVGASDRVDAPDGGTRVDQRFEFSGEIMGAGVRWPRSLKLYQGGQPYFTLDLVTFTPRARR
jgi:hypothetical protein